MPDGPDPFRRLPPDTRRQLDDFVERIERLPVEEMLALAARPLDADFHARALAVADQAARDTLRADALARVRADADDFVLRLYSRTLSEALWYGRTWGRPASAASGRDRANLATSLGEALTALVLWDRLDDADRDELLGAWASLAD